jgi:hypothetical protein
MTVTTFYLFHGDDDLRIEEEVGKLTARMRETPNAELNTAEFDGQTASMSSIVSAVMAYPFMADRRLVIVKGMLSHARALVKRAGRSLSSGRNFCPRCRNGRASSSSSGRRFQTITGSSN